MYIILCWDMFSPTSHSSCCCAGMFVHIIYTKTELLHGLLLGALCSLSSALENEDATFSLSLKWIFLFEIMLCT